MAIATRLMGKRWVVIPSLLLLVAMLPVQPVLAANTPITATITNLNVLSGDNYLPVGGTTIPPGYTSLSVRLDLSNWQPSDNIFVFASYSTDGGATWSDQGGIETNGGVHFGKDGITPIQPGFIAGVPSGTGVKVRAHFIVPTAQQVSGSLTLN